jgi:hypothetical protein
LSLGERPCERLIVLPNKVILPSFVKLAFFMETGTASSVAFFTLSAEEKDDPQHVLQQFFDFARLPQAREFLWLWLKTTIAADFNKALTRRERSDLLHFYEQLQKLIEAAHLIAERRAGAESGNETEGRESD